MQVALGDPRHLELRAHIIFTGADGDPVSSTLRMHQLRRSFCRSWWNDRWRGFMRAYLAFIANGTDAIILPVGDGRAISVGAAPLTFHSPKSLSDAAELMEDEEVVLSWLPTFRNLMRKTLTAMTWKAAGPMRHDRSHDLAVLEEPASNLGAGQH